MWTQVDVYCMINFLGTFYVDDIEYQRPLQIINHTPNDKQEDYVMYLYNFTKYYVNIIIQFSLKELYG